MTTINDRRATALAAFQAAQKTPETADWWRVSNALYTASRTISDLDL